MRTWEQGHPVQFQSFRQVLSAGFFKARNVGESDGDVDVVVPGNEAAVALGAPVPKYGHLSMIVNAQGKPYSKRDGAAFVGEFRDNGYLPEAIFNYLLLLGWNPGDEREVLTREEMVQLFDIEKVHVTELKTHS